MRTILCIMPWWALGWWAAHAGILAWVVWMAVGFGIILCVGGWEENANVRRRAAHSLHRNAYRVLGQDIPVIMDAHRFSEGAVRDAGAILADEVSKRLGWTDRRTGV
jgi:hypothetical protein